MIKFFRKIRQQLLTENKFTKYLLYAIGEIALVVIGILIALQINNWNAQQKESTLELRYLLALSEEFNQNLIGIKAVDSLVLSQNRAAKELLKHTHPNIQSITEEEFRTQFHIAFKEFYRFYPSTSVLQEMISSGHLAKLKNSLLKKELTNWLLRLDWLKEAENEVRTINTNVMNSFREKGNLRNQIVRTISGLDLEQSNFASNNAQLLKEKSFENDLIYFVGASKGLSSNNYYVIKDDIIEILDIINSELELKQE